MNIAETPIDAIQGASHRATSDGVHLVARHYRKGVRLDTQASEALGQTEYGNPSVSTSSTAS